MMTNTSIADRAMPNGATPPPPASRNLLKMAFFHSVTEMPSFPLRGILKQIYTISERRFTVFQRFEAIKTQCFQ
jgi:hypothetical protein